MIYVTKKTINYTVSTLQEVLDLRAYLQKHGVGGYGTLTSFTYTEKPIKEKKEIVGEYYTVKAVVSIDNEKEPEGVLPVYPKEAEEF